MSRTQKAAADLGGGALVGAGVQRVAAEEVDLLELREQSGTRSTARDALHLVDRQKLARLELVGEKLVAAVIVPGNDEDIAADALPARRFEPIRTASFDELDELKFVRRQALAKSFLLVGRV